MRYIVKNCLSKYKFLCSIHVKCVRAFTKCMSRNLMFVVRAHKMLDRLGACTDDSVYAAKMGSELL